MRLGVRRALVAVIVLFTVASLTLLAWHQFATPSIAAGSSADLDGLTTEVQEAGWVNFDMGHVMDGQGGFMMPDAMMPGTPRGEQVRLGVAVTLSNTSSGTVEFNLPQEFTITGGALAAPVEPVADTLGELSRLGPGSAVDALIYFDMEIPDDGDPPIHLRWTRAGSTVEIAVPMTEGDAPPVHQH